MKKELSVLVATAVLTMGLTACGSTEDAAKKEEPKATESKEAKTEKKDTATEKKEASKETAATSEKETRKSEYGTLTVLKKNENLVIAETSGPFKLELNKAQVAKMEVSPNYKQLFKDKDKVTVVTVAMKIENTTDDTNSYYPDQAVLVTNDGEQVEASTFISDHLGGEYIGKVKKQGNVIFLLDGEPEKISHLKLSIKKPHNKEFSPIGEEKLIEFDIK